jgi:hypothetical protein
METQLATADDIKSAAQQFEEIWLTLDARYTRLRAMVMGPLKAAIALEYAKELKGYLDALANSPLAEQKRRLYEAHKYASGVYNRASKRAEIFLKYCNDTRSDWEIVRRREVDELRRKKEQEEQASLFAQREAELEHLRKIGKVAEAEVKEAAPLPPVTVVVDADAGKPEGESLVEVWVPKRDEQGEIVFSDLTAYLVWVTSKPEMHYLVKHQFAKLKKLLTDNRGMIQPPGLVIEHKFEPRTLRESSDD